MLDRVGTTLGDWEGAVELVETRRVSCHRIPGNGRVTAVSCTDTCRWRLLTDLAKQTKGWWGPHPGGSEFG